MSDKDVNITATIERAIDKTSTIKAKNETERLYRYHPKSSSSASSHPSRRSGNNRREKEDQDQEENIDLGIDWNSLPPKHHQEEDWNSLSPQNLDLDESFESSLLAKFLEEKGLRRQEMEWILAEQQENAQMREWLEEQKINLKNREAKLAEVDLTLIPSIKQLQQMEITFDILFNYVSLVNERAVLGNINTKTAAQCLSHELRELVNLGKILKKKQEAEKELVELNMSIAQKQQEVTTLSRDNGNSDNGYGGKVISANDLIRLNLLKSTITDTLKALSVNNNY